MRLCKRLNIICHGISVEFSSSIDDTRQICGRW